MKQACADIILRKQMICRKDFAGLYNTGEEKFNPQRYFSNETRLIPENYRFVDVQYTLFLELSS